MLAVLDISYNNLCGTIPKGRQFNTFTEASFHRNKCLCGFPLPQCNQKDKPKKMLVGDNDNMSVKRGWLSRVNEEVSLVALGIGTGIGFGGIIAMFILWDKARCWIISPPNNTQKLLYGLYRFPT